MRKAFPRVQFKPRPYQLDAVESAYANLQSRPDIWHLYHAPTGTGKSVIELLLMDRIPESILVTPRVEIIRGMLEKLGHAPQSLSETIERGSSYGLYTPIRLRNHLANGTLPFNPSTIILDECHHSTAESWQDIHMYLNGVPVVGFTASPYRGTPKGTEEFRNQWGTINPIISLPYAIANGYCSLPTATIWALIDDDTIDLVNGEIKVAAATSMIAHQYDGIIERIRGFYDKSTRFYDRPTMIAVPSSIVVDQFVKRMNAAGLPAVGVTQNTPSAKRAEAFELTIDCKAILVQIDVVSEGVDLPIRRLIDAKPTMSPVRWVQQIGRIMRPIAENEDPPEYICLCRNLERHCYLMEGLYPPHVLKNAQEAFCDEEGNPIYSKRSATTRAIGLEGLGKFVTTPIHLLNGLTAFAYNLVHVDGYTRTEYFVLVNPLHPEPLRARKTSVRVSETMVTVNGVPDFQYAMPEYQWGKWELIESIPDLKGCQTAKARPLTPKQKAYWDRMAEVKGLNPHKEVNERSFQVLPLLMDLRIRL